MEHRSNSQIPSSHMPKGQMLKVLSPVEGKNGKTFWMRIGNAFVNRDASINVYLNAYPTSGKLHIRPLDERDANGSVSVFDRGATDRAATPGFGNGLGAAGGEQDDLPF